MSKGPQPNEKAYPEAPESDEVEPELNQEFVNALIQMGVTESQAKWAVHNSGNVSAEIAMENLFANLENPDYQKPCKVKKAAAPKSNKFQANPESVMMIESMGIPKNQAERALRKCDGDVERAVDWVFSHMDEPASDAEEMQVDQDNSVDIVNSFACSKPEFGKF